MGSRAAIIGGTGVGSRLVKLPGSPVHVPTKYGVVRGKSVTVEGNEFLLIQRHSGGHKVPPHRVNYRALAAAAKALGIEVVLSTAAVGSLRPDWTAGTMAVCSDFFDFTYRRLTMWNDDVHHVDFSHPFAPRCRQALIDSASKAGVEAMQKAVYVSADGPRYETPGEVRLYGEFGGDVVGMTAASEAICFREFGVDYGCLAIVTNLGCGLQTTDLNHEEVVGVMGAKGETIVKILLEAARILVG